MKRKLMTFLTLFFFGIGLVMAQTQVRGTIVDEAGEPVIGASVQLKSDKTKGTSTDMDGKFTLSAPNNAVLVISSIGMKTQEVVAKPTMKIVMAADTELLDEVVVTAMGLTQKKKAIGYAAQEVKADELVKTRQTDLNNAIVGKVSGVRFLGGSGSKFDAGKIFLRGSSSLTSATGSEPIYVVDGVITNPNSINMDDVQSLNVLKGPAATSLYGSRGANGAIIITSKSAQDGKATIDFSHTFMWEKPHSYFKTQQEYGGGYGGATSTLPTFEWDESMPDYLKQFDGRKMYDYGNDSSWGPKFNNELYMPWYAWDPTDKRFGQQAEWKFGMDVNDLYRTGISNTTNIAFGKASKDYSMRISFTNIDRKGIQYNSNAIRRYLTSKINFDVTEKLRVGLDYKYTYRKNHNAATEGYGEFGNFLYSYLQWGNTNVNLMDLKDDYLRPDGTYKTWNINDPTDLSPAYHWNPYALMNEVNFDRLSQWNVMSANIEYDILSNLKIGGNFFGNMRSTVEENKIPMNLGTTSEYRQEQSQLMDTQIQGYLKYNNQFMNERLSFSTALFAEERHYKYQESAAFTRDGLIIDRFWNPDAAVGKPGGSSLLRENKERSLYGTATFGLDDTYFLDFNLRNDWTSTLHRDKNSFLYGGASVSVMASNWVKRSWLNFWKLRASMAQVGSTMDPYLVFPIKVLDTKYGNLTTMRMNRNLRDPYLSPTISTSYEVGTEFRMFANRFWGDFNFYNRDSKDQILDVNVTPASGYNTKKVNAGIIRNRGVELTLGGMPVKTKDWEWTVNFNISKNKNTLVDLLDPNKEQESYQIWWTKFSFPISINAIEGQPIGVIQGNDWQRDKNGNLILGKLGKDQVRPYVDSEHQNQFLGVAQPDFTGGFSSSLSYRNLTLAASLDFSKGGSIVSYSNLWGMGSGTLKETTGNNDRGVPMRDPVEKGGGVHLTGVDKDGNPMDGYIDAQTYYQDLYPQVWAPSVYDATYVKLREVSLSYQLPKKLINKTNIGLTDARISFVAQNPWLIYCGTPNIDTSETGGATMNYIEGGQSISTRSYGITVSLRF